MLLKPRFLTASSAVSWGIRATAVALAVVTFGCGDRGPGRVVVSGAVTHNGQPVKMGEIGFFPTSGTRAPMSGGYIVDGRYMVDAKGGVAAGTYKVEIRAYRPKPEAASTGNPPPIVAEARAKSPGEQFLPAKYNTKTELTFTVEPGGGPVTRDFELTD